VFSECKLNYWVVEDIVSSSKTKKIKDCGFWLPSHKIKCKVIDIECIEENPSSYRAVGEALDRLLEFINASQ